MRYLIIAADYTGIQIQDELKGVISLESLKLPNELINELNFWNNDYKKIMPLSVEERREQEELINNLDSRGLKLVEKIKNSIHEPSKIKYYSEGRLQYLNNNQ